MHNAKLTGTAKVVEAFATAKWLATFAVSSAAFC